MDGNTKVVIDFNKKTFTISGSISDLKPSATGETESMVAIRNESVGITHPDGRPVKCSLMLYVREKDRKKTA